MDEKIRKPQVRFEGFEDDWEQRKLGEISYSLTGYPFESEKFSRSGIRLVRGINVKRGYIDTSSDLTEYWESTKGVEDYLLKEDDILIQMDGALIGQSYAKVSKKDLPALLVQRVTRIREILGCSNNKYMYYAIQRDFLKYIKSCKTETAVPHLSLKDIQNFELSFSTLEEQEKISVFLERVDNLITLHQRKYDKLQNVKKSMLEKMFSKNGMKVPEVRFEGFTDDWEQRKLGELAEKAIGGGTPKTSEKSYWNGNIPWFQSADILEHEVQIASPKKWITEIGLQKSAAQLIPCNSIAIVTRVGVGKLAYIPFSYATSQDFLSLSELKINGNFGCYVIYKLLQKEKNLTQGTSIKGITKDELLNKNINVPCYEEQKEIGRYFSNLDNLITLHQRKLSKLQQLKTIFLEKLLP